MGNPIDFSKASNQQLILIIFLEKCSKEDKDQAYKVFVKRNTKGSQLGASA
ncbi:hypothetical protein [Rossellomorea sp. BNER]|uniref:hypothetical protein n=1 Tax=Rossellomorea sp. BNER TaxID=2962031 RepID=UPI003AF29286|nr:hypothetical protein [Rossellomorea sp. BNER]